MRTKNFFLATILLFSLPLLVSAQVDSESGKAAVRQTLRDYFDAMKNNDAQSLRKAVHPKAKSFNAGDRGRVWEISFERIAANLESNARRQMSQPNATLKIVAIDITGDTATAKIETEGAKLTEYLSLIKFDSGWKIVTRVISFGQEFSHN